MVWEPTRQDDRNGGSTTIERVYTMSILDGKKIIIIGDRDGIPGQAIEECVKTVPTAQVVYSATECFV